MKNSENIGDKQAALSFIIKSISEIAPLGITEDYEPTEDEAATLLLKINSDDWIAVYLLKGIRFLIGMRHFAVVQEEFERAALINQTIKDINTKFNRNHPFDLEELNEANEFYPADDYFSFLFPTFKEV